MRAGFTESTLLDLVTDDGRSGFMVRLARHVDEAVAWVWLVTYGPEGIHGFVDDSLPCSPTRTVDDGSGATYSVAVPGSHGRSAWIRREGAADSVTGGRCTIDVLGTAGDDVPRGPGPARLQVDATFAARARRVGGNLPGRTESIVDVRATVTVDGRSRSVSGLGQFHEQLQEAPRFDTPFTYTSLRSRDRSLVGLRGPKAGRAVIQSAGETVAHPGFEIEPRDPAAPMGSRRFRVERRDGDGRVDGEPIVHGEIAPTITYTVPILHGRRPSAIVCGVLDGRPVTGFVNDWRP